MPAQPDPLRCGAITTARPGLTRVRPVSYCIGMRLTVAVLVLSCALTGPAVADNDAREGVRDGFGLIQEGTRLMLRGLMEEIDPMLRDLQDRIGDLSAYHPPEILPNGDILIRRKVPLEPSDEIDL